jgi:hypothetical protein
MAKALLTDEEFIALWNKHPSPSEISRIIGMGERAVYSRRNRIESKHGIVLSAPELRGTPKYTNESTNIIMSARKDVNKFTIDNGMIVIGSDAHYSPGVIPVAHKAFCNVIAEYSRDIRAVILNGDILDGGSISRHDRIRWKKSPTVKQELEAVQERLGEIEKVRPPGAYLMRTYGNHDMRFETRLSGQVPQYEGIGGFLLKDHLPHWIDSERIDINDDCVVIHDWHSGVHSGWNETLKGGCTVVTGHTHELSAKAHKGFKNTHFGVKTGMLADEDQDEFSYRNGKPGFNWQSGFAVLTWVDGMLLHPEFAAVRDDGKCYFRGRLFAE